MLREVILPHVLQNTKTNSKRNIAAGVGVPKHMPAVYKDVVVVPNMHVPAACDYLGDFGPSVEEAESIPCSCFFLNFVNDDVCELMMDTAGNTYVGQYKK